MTGTGLVRHASRRQPSVSAIAVARSLDGHDHAIAVARSLDGHDHAIAPVPMEV